MDKQWQHYTNRIRHKRLDTIWYHLYKVSRTGKFIEAESKLLVYRCQANNRERLLVLSLGQTLGGSRYSERMSKGPVLAVCLSMATAPQEKPGEHSSLWFMFSEDFSPSWQKKTQHSCSSQSRGREGQSPFTSWQTKKQRQKVGPTLRNPLPPARPHLQKVCTQSDEVGTKS